ncbi:uncharacterized protein LOC119539193 [Choloepus didactylus]|uniref:uncharacterized protein LOC119539193 n=1 Tax=Choloepus didactylus TaxID=27675 RepID=UPI0018A03E3F|nr:uncharacterized protein LOC119539193 [Choloepus didactylus]
MLFRVIHNEVKMKRLARRSQPCFWYAKSPPRTARGPFARKKTSAPLRKQLCFQLAATPTPENTRNRGSDNFVQTKSRSSSPGGSALRAPAAALPAAALRARHVAHSSARSAGREHWARPLGSSSRAAGSGPGVGSPAGSRHAELAWHGRRGRRLAGCFPRQFWHPDSRKPPQGEGRAQLGVGGGHPSPSFPIPAPCPCLQPGQLECVPPTPSPAPC